MSEELVINAARSYTIGVRGRCLNTVRNHHFVIDDPSVGEEMTPAEHFLAGVSSCAVNLIDKTARESDIQLSGLSVEVEAFRLASDTSRFQHIDMRFVFDGVAQEQAQSLVDEYTRGCPLYGAAAAATTVNIDVSLA